MFRAKTEIIITGEGALFHPIHWKAVRVSEIPSVSSLTACVNHKLYAHLWCSVLTRSSGLLVWKTYIKTSPQSSVFMVIFNKIAHYSLFMRCARKGLTLIRIFSCWLFFPLYIVFVNFNLSSYSCAGRVFCEVSKSYLVVWGWSTIEGNSMHSE